MSDSRTQLPETSEADFEQLAEKLIDKDRKVRRQAIIDLKELGDSRAVPLLIEKLQDKSSKVQLAAIWALEEFKDEKAIEPLMAVLQNKKRKLIVRSQAAEVLGRLKDERSIELLSAIVADSAENLEVRQYALEGVSFFNTPQVDELILNCFLDKTVPEDLRYDAVGLMGELPVESSYQILVDILKGHEESGHIRANAAYALGIFGEDAALQPLLDATSDPDEEVRSWVINGLGHLELTEAVPRLIEILMQDEDDGVRSAAAYSLGNLKDPLTIEPLIAALRDKSWHVRWWVIAALDKIGDKRAVPALRKMLKDRSGKVARWAAIVLDNFHGTKSAGNLEAVEEPENRKA